MDKPLAPAIGHVPGRIFRLKRMELSIFLWIAVFCLPTAAYLIFLFRGSGDHVNTDAYDILDDAVQANTLNYEMHALRNWYAMNFYGDMHTNNTGCTFSIGLSPLTGQHSIAPGYMFPSLIESIFMVKGYEYTMDYQFIQGTITCTARPVALIFRINYTISGLLKESRWFSVPVSYWESTGQTTFRERCLSMVHVMFSDYDDLSAMTIHRLEYGNVCATTLSVTVQIHDAQEPFSFDFPAIQDTWPYFLSLVLLIIGFFGLLAFIWHCWSVRFILVKRAITSSGLTMR